MKFSKLELTWLSIGAALLIVTELLTINGSANQGVVRLDSGSRSLMAESMYALTTGGYKPGQVAFWTGSNTIGGTDRLRFDPTKGRVTTNSLYADWIQSADATGWNGLTIKSAGALNLWSGPNDGTGTPRGVRIYQSALIGPQNGEETPRQSLEVHGGFLLQSNRGEAKKPSCTLEMDAGTFWFASDFGKKTKDTLEVCAKDSNGTPGWRKLY